MTRYLVPFPVNIAVINPAEALRRVRNGRGIELKMAMALRGKNVHYAWHEIMPRHWFSQSGKVDFPKEQMQHIIDDAAGRLDSVIDTVAAKIPRDFPGDIAEAIFSGMRQCMA